MVGGNAGGVPLGFGICRRLNYTAGVDGWIDHNQDIADSEGAGLVDDGCCGVQRWDAVHQIFVPVLACTDDGRKTNRQ